MVAKCAVDVREGIRTARSGCQVCGGREGGAKEGSSCRNGAAAAAAIAKKLIADLARAGWRGTTDLLPLTVQYARG